MSDAFETIVGKVCVERGWITREQIVECLKLCGSSADPAAAGGRASHLTDLLVSRGLVAADQMSALREEVSRILANDSTFTIVHKQDNSLGQILVESGSCKKEHLIEALSIQEYAASKGGTVPRLGEILLQKGYTSFSSIERALGEQNQKSTLSCAGCKARYSVVDYNPRKKYLCKKCSGTLLPPGQTQDEVPPDVTRAQANPKNVLGKYVVVQEIGRGGMGAVYKAWDTQLRRWTALKILLTTGAQEDVLRFRREAQTAASLKHPNIVGIYEVTDSDDKHLIAMEYIEGRSLAGEKLPALKAADLIARISRALDYAHSRGVIHRDIKPHNIMVDGQGTPYLMDFGLAKSLEGPSHLTVTGTVVGTPGYMSPEQAAGRTSQVDRQSDVYSLGAVLYEVLTGHAPFKGANAVDTLKMVMNDDPVPPSELNPAVLRDLETIVLKCLEKERSKRYPGAKALAQDLEQFVEGRAIVAKRAPASTKLARKIRRQWVPLVAAGASLLVFVLVLVLVSGRGGGKPAQLGAMLARGDAALQRGDAAEALRQYQAAAALAPGDAEIPKKAATARKILTDFEDSERRRVEAMRAKSQPELDQGRNKMGRARTLFYQAGVDLSRADGLLQEAYDHASRAAQINPGNPEAHHLRGQIAYLRQNLEGAEKDFTAALAAMKDYSQAWYDRARVYLDLAAGAMSQVRLREKAAEDEAAEWRDKARADLGAWRQKGGADPEQLEFAEVLLAASELKHEQVVEIAERLIARQTTHEEVFKLMGDALAELGHRAPDAARRTGYYDRAVKAYSDAITRRANHPEAFLERGHVQLHAGRREEAAKDLERVASLKFGGARWLVQRGSILHEFGRVDEAAADYEQALKLRPGDPQILSNLGQIYYQKRDYGRAREQYDLILKSAPKNASALSSRGIALVGGGDPDAGLADLLAARAIQPSLRDLDYRVGTAQLARKDYAKAAEEFDRHLASNLNDERGLYARGQARAGLGRLEEALQDWERVVAMNSRLAPQARQHIAETRARLGR